MENYSISQLSALVDLPIRTIRYYIQKGLVDRPFGERKAARYGQQHLEQCLLVRKWTRAGLSLEKIALALRSPPKELPTPSKKVGEISVVTTVHIAPGVQIQIDPSIANIDHQSLQTIALSLVNMLEICND